MPSDESKDNAEKANQILKMLEALGMNASGPKEHRFWNTQPVPQSQAELMQKHEEGPIQPEKPEIKDSPLPLPEEFEWFDLDLADEKDKNDLYVLLNENYVEDVSSLFRFDYPPHFLDWALLSPGWKRQWHVGVRVKANAKLVAFISAIPTKFMVRSKQIDSVEVNFLCVHKKLRAKRLAPVMIKEITRRVNLNGIFQALYTAGTLLPEPVTIAQYFHRPLNYKKLCQTQFASLPSGKTMVQMEQRYSIERENLMILRPIELDDIPSAFKLFKTYMEQYKLTPIFDEEEFAHWVLPRDQILKTYVREVDGKISGFASYYSLPTSVLSPDSSCPHDKISVAYLFYYAHDEQTDLIDLIEATLAKAQDEGFDVFNCVEIMENGRFLDKLKFAAGDGNLHYYLFNWKAGLFESSEVAVVML